MKTLAFIPIALALTAIAGWVTHIIWSIGTILGDLPMTINQGVVAVIGAIVPPIGTIHGVYLWFV